jgi:acyl carrier protein
MTRDDFRGHLAEFLMVDLADVQDEANLSELGWDSLALLSVISIAEETWGIEVGEEQLNRCVLVQDMLEFFDAYLVGESA